MKFVLQQLVHNCTNVFNLLENKMLRIDLI